MDIDIFIMTNGRRPEYLNETINSISKIIIPPHVNVKFKVSVNTQERLILENAEITVIQNKTSNNLLHHIIDCLDYVEADLVVFFHDDDLFDENFLVKSLPFFYNEKVAAVGGNSIIFSDDRFIKKIYFNRQTTTRYINKKSDLVKLYLQVSSGAAPFPSYVYRFINLKEALLRLRQFYRYSDIKLLMNLIEDDRQIVLVPEVVMATRWHALNDTNDINQEDEKFKFELMRQELSGHFVSSSLLLLESYLNRSGSLTAEIIKKVLKFPKLINLCLYYIRHRN